jgi:hypothetical protein
LLKSTEEIPTRPTDEGGIKFPDLSPNLHHAPPLNEDVNKDNDPQENKTKPAFGLQTSTTQDSLEN